MVLTAPLSYPIALFLDVVLGKHSKSRFLNTDLKVLIDLHQRNQLKQIEHFDALRNSGSMGLGEAQADMIKGAIELKENLAQGKMIPFRKVEAISLDTLLTEEIFVRLRSTGHSRLPVYRG